MSYANEYRERAQRCVYLARTAPTKQQKIILLNMARAWIKLAKHVERYQALLGWQGLAASGRVEIGADQPSSGALPFEALRGHGAGAAS
jgi:hypothetical protein